MSNVLFNELPRPTFRWLKVNHTEGTVAAGVAPANVTVYGNEGIVKSLDSRAVINPEYKGAEAGALADVTDHYTAGFAVEVPAGAKETVEVIINAEADSVGAPAQAIVTALVYLAVFGSLGLQHCRYLASRAGR